jgi:alkanesulfonate monooxygenase SsuD/methylene tetrahydromethanopterin reductase-like flavin-dependent oxidoreductase (luciferase family)
MLLSAMRFGLFFQAPEAAGQTHAERYAEMFDVIALADSLGFDVAWLAELHFGGAFSLLANPLMAVPVIAQRTKRIRIGTAVTLLPLHHPLSCAEQKRSLHCAGWPDGKTQDSAAYRPDQ